MNTPNAIQVVRMTHLRFVTAALTAHGYIFRDRQVPTRSTLFTTKWNSPPREVMRLEAGPNVIR